MVSANAAHAKAGQTSTVKLEGQLQEGGSARDVGHRRQGREERAEKKSHVVC